jgi:hypothetical protein
MADEVILIITIIFTNLIGEETQIFETKTHLLGIDG